MARNYYAILGVGRGAAPEEIKAAYRRKAQELHPDHSGAGSKPFLDIQEAYETLGDPARRRAYDDRQAAGQPRRSAPSWRAPVEPLIPDAGDWVGSWGSARHFHGPLESSAGGILDALWGDWGPRPRAASRREAHLEIRLTVEQALRGGNLRLWIPVQVQCPACWGQGGAGSYECWQCSGTGEITEEHPLSISFQPGIASDCEVHIAGEQVGLRGVDLVLHVRLQ